MKKIISLLFVLLISMLLLASCSSKRSNTLYVATSPDYMPFEFVDRRFQNDEKYVGADISLAKHIASKLNMELQLLPMGFSETLVAVQSNKADIAISGFTHDEEREKNYEMSITYKQNGEGFQGLLVLKKNLEKYKTFEDVNIAGINVGGQLGSEQLSIIEEKLDKAVITKFNKIDEGILQLKEEKIDAIAIASITGEIIAKKDAALALSDVILDEAESDLFVIAKKGNTVLMDKINTIIEQVNEDGLYDLWLDEAITLIAYLNDLAGIEEFGEADNNNFLVRTWNIFINNIPQFAKATMVTISLSLFGVLFAILIGTFICFLNMSKYKSLKVISRAYIEIIRGIPLLLQLYAIYALTPRGASAYYSCLIAIVINSSAYVAEIIRGGINAVSIGQTEAGRSLGFSKIQTLFKIVLPQAIKNVLPSLCNEFITLIKETSLASVFFVGDLLTIKNEISADTYLVFEPYLIIGCIYFILTFSLSKLVKKAEGWLAN